MSRSIIPTLQKTILLVLFLNFLPLQNLFAQNVSLAKLTDEQVDEKYKTSYAEGDYQTALQFMTEKRSRIINKIGKTDSTYADACNELATIYVNLGDFELAEPLILEAVALEEKISGKSHLRYISKLTALGIYYYYTGQQAKAEQTYLNSLALAEKHLGKKSDSYAELLNNLAVIYWEKGSYDLAETNFLKSIYIFVESSGKENEDYAAMLNNLATLYIDMGHYEKAEPLFLEVLEIESKLLGQEHPTRASTINNLSVLYYRMGRFEEAGSLLQEAKSVLLKAYGAKHIQYSHNLNNMALIYERMEDYKNAIALNKEALEIRSSEANSWEYAQTLSNLALLYTQNREYALAEPLFLKAEMAYKKQLGAEHKEYALILSNLGDFYRRSGQLDKAEPYYLKSIAILEKKAAEKNAEYAQVLTYLATFYRTNQQLDLALQTAWKSLRANSDLAIDFSDDALSKLPDAKFISITTAIESLQELAATMDAYQKEAESPWMERSYALYKAALKINLDKIHEFGPEATKLRILKENNFFVAGAIKGAVSLAKKNANITLEEDAFLISEQNKANLLAQALKSQRARSFGNLPDTLVAKEIKLQEELAQLNKSLLLAASEAEKSTISAQLNNSRQEVKAFMALIEEKFPKYFDLKYSTKNLNLADFQKALGDKELMLAYLIEGNEGYVFALSKKGLKVLPLNLAELAARTQALRKALSNYSFISEQAEEAYKLYTENAFWFFVNMVEPALKLQEEQFQFKPKTLIIIPDGDLAHLPFEAFLQEKANGTGKYKELKYLVQDYIVNYNYSASLWKENLESPKKQNNGLIFAAAAQYGNIDNKSATRANRAPHLRNLRDALDDLPAAKEEVESLARLFKGTFLYGMDANEVAFKSKAKDYGVIHLAMHGLLNEKFPILSSLAFTENGDSLSDNFLQAYEISQLQLNADLVVLSACETGYGKFAKGEGVMSLARSFMYAGVPSIVVSMWQVHDASTSIIMQMFYKNLGKGMNKAEALRKAKLSYLDKAGDIAAHPAFWAPFVQVGDYRAIELVSKGNIQWIVGGGIALFVLTFIGISRFRRKQSA